MLISLNFVKYSLLNEIYSKNLPWKN